MELQKKIKPSQHQAQLQQPVLSGGKMHLCEPADYVQVKEHEWKSQLSPRWERLFLVLLTFFSAVFVIGQNTWIYHSHVKLARTEEIKNLLKIRLKKKKRWFKINKIDLTLIIILLRLHLLLAVLLLILNHC